MSAASSPAGTATSVNAGVHVFGIRHHGPGSARSLLNALETLTPDCLLVEGPPDADALLPMVLHKEMVPPVALLVYAANESARAVFYPFAVFSPEWQALRFGLSRGIPTRFFDLPVAHAFAEDAGEQADGGTASEAPPETPADALQLDPLSWLARAAGYDDGERWWEQLVEERQDSTGVFEAILEAMTALRAELPERDNLREQQREAHMRTALRHALAEGFQRIAVVCGAWHAPALTDLSTSEKDAALLHGLAATPVHVTWIPWTFGRLARLSGYGAGITSPGWYEHLWLTHEGVSTRWLARVASLLREQDLEASSAQVIEAVRLADTLAALRGRSLAGLDELNDASSALFAHGSNLALQLISERLIVGERLGRVPAETPAAPLQQDLEREAKRLRLTMDAAVKDLDLDLRKDFDLQRSQLLHRLDLLGITWGHAAHARGRGTFKERWQLRWEPAFAVTLIEAGRYGQTVAQAASSRVLELARTATLPELTSLLDRTLLAALPQVAQALLHHLGQQATEDTDMTHLMGALPPLARVMRYGNVRQTDTALVGRVVDSLFVRITVGLPNACAALSDDAATTMHAQLLDVHGAVMLLQQAEQVRAWQATLTRLAERHKLHGLIAGRCLRLLLDMDALTVSDVAQRLGLALSDPDPEKAGAWVEGFLKGSGLVLVHDNTLFGVLDSWLAALNPEVFIRLLPLLRRTFSSFETPERQAIGKKAGRSEVVAMPTETNLNATRGDKVLPLASKLLGLDVEVQV